MTQSERDLLSPSEKDLEANLNAIDDVREITKHILAIAYSRSGFRKSQKDLHYRPDASDLIEAGRLAGISERACKALADLQKAVQSYGPTSLD